MSPAALGEAVRARRDHLGLTQADLVRRAGVSDVTVRRMEQGRPGSAFRSTTCARVEAALGWPAGTIDDTLRGFPPPPPSAPAPDTLAAMRGELDAMHDSIATLTGRVDGLGPSTTD